MDLKELQRHWNRFGEEDPYWAILTDDAKKGGGWNPEEFFQTGVAEIEALMTRVAALGEVPQKERALDFGCGAGRLTQALGRHFDRVAGVDIAPSMIELARQHNRLQDRCEYFLNENNSLALFESGSFDLVYSILVLQHMRPELAKGYIREFARVLAPGGVLVFQLPAERERDPTLLPPPDVGSFRARHPSLHHLLSRLGVVALYRKIRPATPAPSRGSTPEASTFRPVMEMNCVPRAEVERELEAGGLRVVKADAHALPGFTSYFYWAQKPR